MTTPTSPPPDIYAADPYGPLPTRPFFPWVDEAEWHAAITARRLAKEAAVRASSISDAWDDRTASRDELAASTRALADVLGLLRGKGIKGAARARLTKAATILREDVSINSDRFCRADERHTEICEAATPEEIDAAVAEGA